jgi:chromosome segregation ATPase
VRKELIGRANEELAKVEGTDYAKGGTPSADLQRKRKALQAERNKFVEVRADAKALLNGLPNEIAAARTEQGTEQARLETGVIVRCTICHVNIDEVKAKGCGISLERCNLDEVRTRIDHAQQRVADMEQQKSALPGEITKLDAEIARLDLETAAIDETFIKLERQLSDANKKQIGLTAN